MKGEGPALGRQPSSKIGGKPGPAVFGRCRPLLSPSPRAHHPGKPRPAFGGPLIPRTLLAAFQKR
eukprot:10925592-Alexandrium_andersonii.AAC.1